MKNQKFNGFHSEEEYNDVLEIVKRYLDIDTSYLAVFKNDAGDIEIAMECDDWGGWIRLFEDGQGELEIDLDEQKKNRNTLILSCEFGCIGAVSQLIVDNKDGVFDFVWED